MKRYTRKMRLWFLQGTLLVAGIFLLVIPGISKLQKDGNNIFTIKLDGVTVGILDSKESAYACLREARRAISTSDTELTMAVADMETEGRSVYWGEIDDEDTVTQNMIAVLEDNLVSTLNRSYTVKINEYYVNLASKEDVYELLETSISKYDTENLYDVQLVLDSDREVNVLTPLVESVEEIQKEEEAEKRLPEAGFFADMTSLFDDIKPLITDMAFEDYELGLQSIDFADKIEIVESYLPAEEITDIETAIDEVTKDKETNEIYEVKSGDTLGSIALAYGLTVDDLVQMNDSIESATSTIRTEDEIIVTVPEPELSVVYTVLNYYEEDYEAEVQYVDNDSWYTTQTKVLQEPSAGHRKVVALVTYENDSSEETDIQKEEITYMAVPKIIERGTIVPPTYIKPISGGRLTSGFGKRSAPTKGASTYHKGVDWATPIGTAVMASSSGTVTRAGWGSGYGYCVYIKHADGKETRYGHLSKVLVSVGQTVKQGEKIALSGNTGVSTGPHLHFEILVNGTQVNPLNYLN